MERIRRGSGHSSPHFEFNPRELWYLRENYKESFQKTYNTGLQTAVCFSLNIKNITTFNHYETKLLPKFFFNSELIFIRWFTIFCPQTKQCFYVVSYLKHVVVNNSSNIKYLFVYILTDISSVRRLQWTVYIKIIQDKALPNSGWHEFTIQTQM